MIKKLLLLHCFFAAQLYALELDVVVIEGTKNQNLATSDLVRQAQDLLLPPTEVADFLIAMPGLQIDSRNNYAQDTRINIRGFGARSPFGVRSIDLIVDGIPQSTPDGQTQWSGISVDTLESVKLVTGPMSVLYGNSPGGALIINSKIPENNQLQLEQYLSSQSQTLSRMRANLRENGLAISAGIEYQQSDTERPHARAEKRQESLSIYYQDEDQRDWIVKWNRNYDPLLQDPLGLTLDEFLENPFQKNSAAINFDTRKSINNQQMSFLLRQANGDSRWQIGLWQTQREVEQYLGFSGAALTSAGGVVNLDRLLNGVNLNFTQDFDWLNHTWQLSLGAEAVQMQDDRLGFVNLQGVKGNKRRDEVNEAKNVDLFSMLSLWITDSSRIYLAHRHSTMDFSVEDNFVFSGINPDDSGERDFSDSATALGFSQNFSNDWSLIIQASKGFETPSLTEMAYRTDASGFNTELSPSEQTQVEWGLQYLSPTHLAKLTEFYVDTQGEIMVDQSLNGRTSYKNALATERKGWEFFYQQRLQENWRLYLSMQYLDAVFEKGHWVSNQLPGIAKEVYQAGLVYEFPSWPNLRVNLSTQHRSKVAVADNNQAFSPSYSIWNFSLEGDLLQSSLHWWLNCQNVMDTSYVGSVIVNQASGRAVEPGLGRTTWLGIRYIIQP